MVRFVCAEMSAALDFLKIKNIVHRDVKPENILLDEKGHCHLTDFNVATYLNKGCYLKNMAGTKPYMAPEIFKVHFITFYQPLTRKLKPDSNRVLTQIYIHFYFTFLRFFRYEYYFLH